MRKKLTVVLIAAMVITVFVPVTAMAQEDWDSEDAGKYGTLWGYNFGSLIETTIDQNDGSGILVNGYEVQNDDTGETYGEGSEDSEYGDTSLETLTFAGTYPSPCAVFGSHEVRGDLARDVYTLTIY